MEIKRLRDGSGICSLEGVSDWDTELQRSDLDSKSVFADCKCTPRGSQNLSANTDDLLASNPSFSFQILSHSFREGKSCETKSGTENLGLGLSQKWAYFSLLLVPLHGQKHYPLVRTSIALIPGFPCLQIFYCLQYAKTFDSCAYCKQSKAGGPEELGTRLVDNAW